MARDGSFFVEREILNYSPLKPDGQGKVHGMLWLLPQQPKETLCMPVC
jgi:hypothetical protein